MWAVAVAVVAAVVVAALLRVRRRLLMITVHGNSMSPTFADGDRLLVRRGPPGAVGDIVVFAHPRPLTGDLDLLVKRVAAGPGDAVPEAARGAVGCSAVPTGHLVVLGDNTHSLDSRKLGLIAAEAVVGVVARRVGQAS